MTRYLKG